jgi:hypothetical protein
MWLKATIPQQDLLELAREMTPLAIRLGEDGCLEASEPSEVVLVAGEGLRLTCKAKLHWSVIGVSVPVTIHSVTLMVRPRVERLNGRDRIALDLHIEHADVAALPALIDERLTARVNKELAARHSALAWAYGDTLSRTFELPGALRPLSRLRLQAAEARVEVTQAAVCLAIRFLGTSERYEEAAAS